MLHDTADYVNSVAKGNVATIQLAGFTATSDVRLPATTPQTPGAPTVSGNAAHLTLLVTKVDGATSYCWLIFLGEPVVATVNTDCITVPGGTIMIIPDGHMRRPAEPTNSGHQNKCAGAGAKCGR